MCSELRTARNICCWGDGRLKLGDPPFHQGAKPLLGEHLNGHRIVDLGLVGG